MNPTIDRVEVLLQMRAFGLSRFESGDLDLQAIADFGERVGFIWRRWRLTKRVSRFMLLYGQAIEHTLQPSQICLERTALFAEAGVALARDSQATLGYARLLAKAVGTRPKDREALVQCGDVFVERLQCLLAGETPGFRLLRRECRRAQVVVGLAAFGARLAETGAVRMQQQVVQLGSKGVGALGTIGLRLEPADVRRQFGQDVLNAHQIGLSGRELRARVVQPKLMAADVGRVLEGGPSLVGSLENQLVDGALTNDRIAVGTQPGVEQQLSDVLEANPGTVEQIFAVARPVQPPCDAHFVVLDRQAAVAVVEHQRHFRHTQRLARRRAAKNHFLWLARPDRLRRLLAQDPQDPVGDVGLSRAIRTDDDDDAREELSRCAGGERFEADQVQTPQKQALSSMPVWGYSDSSNSSSGSS